MMIKNKRCRIILTFTMCLWMMTMICACGSKATEDKNASESAENVVQITETVAGQELESKEDATDPPAADDTDVANTSDGAENTEAPENEDNFSKVLVVYFSHTGTTKGVSEYLHEIVGGDIIEIKPVNPYPEGYHDALDPAKQEQKDNARPEIANTIDDFDSYEVIYLGYPIWWGTTPMIINTFLESYDFSGKTVVPFATSGGTGISQSIKDIRSEIPDADVKDGLLAKSNDDISPWLQELGLYE